MRNLVITWLMVVTKQRQSVIAVHLLRHATAAAEFNATASLVQQKSLRECRRLHVRIVCLVVFLTFFKQRPVHKQHLVVHLMMTAFLDILLQGQTLLRPCMHQHTFISLQNRVAKQRPSVIAVHLRHATSHVQRDRKPADSSNKPKSVSSARSYQATCGAPDLTAFLGIQGQMSICAFMYASTMANRITESKVTGIPQSASFA